MSKQRGRHQKATDEVTETSPETDPLESAETVPAEEEAATAPVEKKTKEWVLSVGLLVVLTLGLVYGAHWWRQNNPYEGSPVEPGTTTTIPASAEEALGGGVLMELLAEGRFVGREEVAEALFADLRGGSEFEVRYENNKPVVVAYLHSGDGCEKATVRDGDVRIEELEQTHPCRPEAIDQPGLGEAEQAMELLVTPDAGGTTLLEYAARAAEAEERRIVDILEEYYPHGMSFSEAAGLYENEVSVHQAEDGTLWVAVSRNPDACLWASVNAHGEIAEGETERPPHGCAASEIAE